MTSDDTVIKTIIEYEQAFCQVFFLTRVTHGNAHNHDNSQ